MKSEVPSFEPVVRRYADVYLRRLSIEHHLQELAEKLRKHLSEDRNPFEQPDFVKELADLGILLEMHAYHDPDFRESIRLRRYRFLEKVERGR